MNVNPFLTCLSNFGVSTGTSIKGLYSFGSGDDNLVYNEIYPISYHYQGSYIFAPSYPLINMFSGLQTNVFSGVDCVRVGYQNNSNFGLLFDIEYNSCSKKPYYDYVLVSTAQNVSDLGSGFIIGINDSNRIYFKTSGYCTTISKELTNHDFIYCSLSQNQYVGFGVYNVSESIFYSQNIDVGSGILTSSDLFLGNLLNANQNYTGFSGIINNVFLFQNSISNDDIATCINCSFVTGFGTGIINTTVDALQITGTYFSGLTGLGTSSSEFFGEIEKEDGSFVTVVDINNSQIIVTSGQVALPLYGITGISTSSSQISLQYDNEALASFSNFQVSFLPCLQSGDNVEIYTYANPNINIGLFLNSFNYPSSTGFVQLIGNGLEEVNDIDYSIVRNQISGYDSSDILTYDIGSTDSLALYFTGEWSDVVASGLLFDPIPNFDQNYGEQYLPTIINLTGVSGVCTGNSSYPNFGYDIYLNGQKMLSGFQYNITDNMNSGFVVSISGDEVMNAYTQVQYNETGWYLSRFVVVDECELLFIPQFSGFQGNIYQITGNQMYITGLTGFSEQVWVNGVRQVLDNDYFKISYCSTVSGSSNFDNIPLLFYNNYSLFNFDFPPSGASNYNMTFVPSGTSYLNINISWNPINIGDYQSGTYLELWGNSSGNSSSLLSTLDILSTGYVWTFNSTGHNTFTIKTRYRNNNIIGVFSSEFSGNH